MTEELNNKILRQAEVKAAACVNPSEEDLKMFYARSCRFVIKALWHTEKEEPLPGREIIVIGRNGVKIYPNPSNNKMSWRSFVRSTRTDKWAYAEDILPEAEDDGITDEDLQD